MYILEAISAVDLIAVCLITVVCVITMVCIIVVSSKSPKQKKENVEISLGSIPRIEKVEEVKEKPIRVEPPKPRADIQSVLDKMENELENGPKEVSHTFEEEQEEKAIISYRELLKVAGKLKAEIKENEEQMEKREPQKVEIVKEIPKEEDRRFRGTEFISPVYGKQESVVQETYAGRHEEKEKTDDFLSQLKDLRKNLE